MNRTNFILRWLSTNGKEAMSKIISTQTTDHPIPDTLTYIPDLAYESVDGTPLGADVYRPKDTSADPLPIVVFVHGGGLFCSSRKANREYAELLAERGYVVFVPSYRLIDEADGPHSIADVCTGLTFLKNHASEFGGDLSRVFVNGESAGAFLSLYAVALTNSAQLRETFGIDAPDLDVRGFASFGGMLYTAEFDMIGLVYRRSLYGDRLGDEAFMELINPEDPRVEPRLPPVLQVSSSEDFLKKYTLRYNRALALTGHEHRLIYFQHGKELAHAFPSLQPKLPQSKVVLDELDLWIRALLDR